MSFIKEKKLILSSFTKFSSEDEITAEVWGYQHAQKSGLRTAKLLHWSKNAISVELINGISSFYFLHLCNIMQLSGNAKNLLRLLVHDIDKFQSVDFIADSNFHPYPIRKKLAEIVDVMDMVSHPYTTLIRDKAREIENIFLKYARFPFRDANPKNTLLSGVTKRNFHRFSTEEIQNSIRHIDFRSTSELTTRYDDFISTIFHYQISDAMRFEVLDMCNIDQNSEEYLITLFVRLARFWSRRTYYRIMERKLFKQRYSIEDWDFYDRQFDYVANLIAT